MQLGTERLLLRLPEEGDLGEALEREDLPGSFDRRVDLYSLGKSPAR